MDSMIILRVCLFISFILVIAIYFIYRPFLWPGGFEALGCLVALMLLGISVFLLGKFGSRPVVINGKKNIATGLIIGLLWTVEIGINNLVQPGLPLRDVIDNIFWSIVAFLILIFAIVEAFKKRSVSAGINAGFWMGTGSGAIACLTALVLIIFGMNFIVSDPLNIQEWSDLHESIHYPDIKVYFAYQTLAGALLHLVILGTIMGLVIGVPGGIIGMGLGNLFRQKHLSRE
jgi:hypothetical protein